MTAKMLRAGKNTKEVSHHFGRDKKPPPSTPRQREHKGMEANSHLIPGTTHILCKMCSGDLQPPLAFTGTAPAGSNSRGTQQGGGLEGEDAAVTQKGLP